VNADLEALRAAFPDKVDADHALPAEWRAALRAVPREVFVPYFMVSRADRPGWRIVERSDPEWASGVFGNRSLITQLNGSEEAAQALRRGDHTIEGWSTSSSSQPSLMVLMLQALDIADGHRVLEIGTGTGYNAALLCHRLGDRNITTMDLDSVIAAQARTRLAEVGYRPNVLTGDGMRGCAEHAPFDRIVATVAVPHLPLAWIEQTRTGGKILFPLDTRNMGGLMPLLTVTGKCAEGRFLPDFGGFMPVRQRRRHDAAQAAFRNIGDADGEQRTTALGHDIATDDGSAFAFFAALFTGGYDQMSFTPSSGGPTETWIAIPDGSWVCHITTPEGTHRVRQGGPQRLWDRIEDLHSQWLGLDCPERHRFGLTVTADVYRLWLDDPGDERQWLLPVSAQQQVPMSPAQRHLPPGLLGLVHRRDQR
jgi:methyltransferase of ATP-grasp peptide maturase system